VPQLTEITIRTLADIEAIEREMPFERRLAERSSYAAIESAARRFPDRPAIIFLPTGTADDAPVTLTYRELFARITQTANLFTALGVGPRDAVSCLLPNLPQTYFVLWGGAAACIVNAVNALLTPAQIAEILQAADSRVLVTLGPGTELWDKAQAVLKLMPSPVKLLKIGGGDTPLATDFDAELSRYPGDRLDSGRAIAADDIAAYFHTGGTTGSPKLVQHSHGGQVYQAWVNRLTFPLKETDVLLMGGPLFHAASVYCWGLAPLCAGAAIVVLSPSGFRNPSVIRDFWRIVERFSATVAGVVPTVITALLTVPVANADIRSLSKVTCGAAPLSVQTFEAFQKTTGVPIKEGYGLTESTALATINPTHGEGRVGSIGTRIPYTQVKTVVLDADGGFVRDCAVEEIGVVAIRGPTVTPGYKQAQHNRSAFFGEHWLNTGDLGRIDKDGYIWLTGRAKDLIIRGGHNISPAWIEDVLHAHPAVALAAAIGKPDVYAGEIPIAYVMLKPGAQASGEELREYAKQRVVERPAAPHEVIIVDALPMTAVGKIFKPALRHDAIKRCVEGALSELRARGVDHRVEVDAHERHGTLAIIRFTSTGAARQSEITSDANRALAGFAFRYELVW
jgi:fatty-acyl-CoA synthase